MRNKLRLVIWFGGIGADCRAFDRANIGHHIVDCVELDKHAIKAFNLLNGTSFEPKDINDVNVNGYGEVDMLVAGGPCQDLSIAGKQVGLVEGKRSSLIGTTIRKINEMKEKPKVILLENVKGLLSKKHAQDFEVIKGAFKALGYHGSHKLLNSKFFGVPQARERVYCVLKRDKPFTWEGAEKFNKVEVKLKDILDNEAKWETTNDYLDFTNFINTGRNTRGELHNYNFNRYGKDNKVAGTLNTFCLTGVCKKDHLYLTNKLSAYNGKIIDIDLNKLENQDPDNINKIAELKEVNFNQAKNFIGTEGIAGTLRASEGATFENKILTRVSFNQDAHFIGMEGVSPTLTTTNPDFKNKILKQQKDYILYRKLTAGECGKLMGFTTDEFNKVEGEISNSQLCKQAGNSIVVNVLVEIFKELYKTRREKMDNIKKTFKNVKLDDELFYGDGKCAETPDENGDFVSKISERSIARTIMEYSLGILGDNKEIREGADKKLIELSPDYKYQLVIEGVKIIELSPDYKYELEIEDVKVLKAVIGEGGDYSVDIEITFEVIG